MWYYEDTVHQTSTEPLGDQILKIEDSKFNVAFGLRDITKVSTTHKVDIYGYFEWQLLV